MSLTPRKLTPFNVSLLTAPALVVKQGNRNNNKDSLTYEGTLRNEIDLSDCSIEGEPPLPVFAMDYDFRFVIDGQTKAPQAFFLRGGSEKFKLTYNSDGSPRVIFYSVGPKDSTLENQKKLVIRGKVHTETSELYGQYLFANRFKLKFLILKPLQSTG